MTNMRYANTWQIQTTISSSDYLPLHSWLGLYVLCPISAQALAMIRPNFHIWVLLVVPGTRWRWMRHGPVGSNGNQLTPKSFSASSSPSLSSSSITQSPRLLLNQRSGWRMDIRHAKSVHISTNATFATWELAPKKCIKTPKISAKHFTLTISPRCTCSSSTVSTVWAANSAVLSPYLIIFSLLLLLSLSL